MGGLEQQLRASSLARVSKVRDRACAREAAKALVLLEIGGGGGGDSHERCSTEDVRVPTIPLMNTPLLAVVALVVTMGLGLACMCGARTDGGDGYTYLLPAAERTRLGCTTN